MLGGLAVVTFRCVLLGKSSNCSARRANLSARRQPQLTFLPCFKAMPITTSSVLHEQRTRHRKRRSALGRDMHTGWTEHREATELHTRQVTGGPSHGFALINHVQ